MINFQINRLLSIYVLPTSMMPALAIVFTSTIRLDSKTPSVLAHSFLYDAALISAKLKYHYTVNKILTPSL